MFSGYMLNTDYGAPVYKMVLWFLGIRNAEKIYLPVKGAPQPFSFVIIFYLKATREETSGNQIRQKRL